MYKDEQLLEGELWIFSCNPVGFSASKSEKAGIQPPQEILALNAVPGNNYFL